MTLTPISYDFSVCKVKEYAPGVLSSEFVFLGKTDGENSLVCPTEDAPEDALERDDGWKAFRIEGVLDFSLIGILSKISALLAEAGIGIFAVSTYNTDYILTKKENFGRALDVLRAAGYAVAE